MREFPKIFLRRVGISGASVFLRGKPPQRNFSAFHVDIGSPKLSIIIPRDPFVAASIIAPDFCVASLLDLRGLAKIGPSITRWVSVFVIDGFLWPCSRHVKPRPLVSTAAHAVDCDHHVAIRIYCPGHGAIKSFFRRRFYPKKDAAIRIIGQRFAKSFMCDRWFFSHLSLQRQVARWPSAAQIALGHRHCAAGA